MHCKSTCRGLIIIVLIIKPLHVDLQRLDDKHDDHQEDQDIQQAEDNEDHPLFQQDVP